MSSSQKLPLEFFQKLPKSDLHVHLDGSLRLSTIVELAEQGGITLPAKNHDALRKAMNLGENCGSLVEYLKAFDVTLKVLQNESKTWEMHEHVQCVRRPKVTSCSRSLPPD